MKKIVIIGAGGHGKVVADIAKLNGYEKIYFIDDDEKVKACGNYPVVGTSSIIEKYIEDKYDFFVAVGNAFIRKQFIEHIYGKANLISLIHPSAVIASDVSIELGTVVMAGSVVNSGTKIGTGCIINTCASVDHDCVVEAYSHISVGAHLCGTVSIGNNTWIGAGAIINNNISVCDDVVIGSGAVVVNDIKKNGTYVGIPASELLK